jgi:predicted DNA-binding transcriptional regulator AlpA
MTSLAPQTRGEPSGDSARAGLPGSLLTTAELCTFLRLSRSSVWRLRQAGLPTLAVRGLLRFDRERVLAWLAEPAASAPADPLLPPGEYRCRGCGFTGMITQARPASTMRCACGSGSDVERV